MVSFKVSCRCKAFIPSFIFEVKPHVPVQMKRCILPNKSIVFFYGTLMSVSLCDLKNSTTNCFFFSTWVVTQIFNLRSSLSEMMTGTLNFLEIEGTSTTGWSLRYFVSLLGTYIISKSINQLIKVYVNNSSMAPTILVKKWLIC